MAPRDPHSQPESAPGRSADRRRTLFGLLAVVIAIIALYSAGFHLVMSREGQSHSWATSLYWTLQTMTTLGYGDVIFASDLGRTYAIVVLLTGVLLLFVLLPFTLIQFVYAPWLEARNAARTPRQLPPDIAGHVILTTHGPVEAALIQRLAQFNRPYVVIEPDTARALALHDQGVRVMVGDLDSPETYRRACVDRAALVATTLSDTVNANVVLTVRECCETVPIVATATWEASVDLLKRAGADPVIQLGELLGRAMARRIAGHGGRTHVVGQLDGLLIAEAAAAGTSLVGMTVRESRLRERFDLNVVGTWERGRYLPGSADTRITGEMTLLLSGTRTGLDGYDREIRTAPQPPITAIVIGAGRVGRATSRALAAAGIDHRIVERQSDRVQDWSRYVIGDATDPDVLQAAGLEQASAVAITTHDDDVNIYLTLYCRRMQPHIQVLSRATLERNVSTLHRAGADFVLSYVPMEANAIFDILRRGNLLVLAEGIEVFTVKVPAGLAGKPIAHCNLRADTGCNVLAVRPAGGRAEPPDIMAPLEAGAELILIGDRQDEKRFFERYG